MDRWSYMRHKLENDYLASCLRGRVRYFVTRYYWAHDYEGRAAILVDGQEVVSGGYFESWPVELLFSAEERIEMDKHWYEGLNQRHFYEAFHEFDTQTVQESLQSGDQIVRLFALLDRRVGKRTLQKLREGLDAQTPAFRRFWAIRMAAEGLISPEQQPAI